jgi:hypothetical protein
VFVLIDFLSSAAVKIKRALLQDTMENTRKELHTA